MRQRAIHDDIGRQTAIAQLAFCPVNPACARTKRAGFVEIEKGLNNHRKPSYTLQGGAILYYPSNIKQ
jgi:hypothetical protein